MLKIRRPLGRLIFNMGIAIPGKTVFLIETAPGPLRPANVDKGGIFNFDIAWREIYFLGLLLACIIQTNVTVKYIESWVSPLQDTSAVCMQSCFRVYKARECCLELTHCHAYIRQ